MIITPDPATRRWVARMRERFPILRDPANRRAIRMVADLFDPPGADSHTAFGGAPASTNPAATGTADTRGDSR